MIIGIGIFILVIFLADKALSYYGTVLGLLSYLGERHKDIPNANTIKELRDAALARRIKEFLS